MTYTIIHSDQVNEEIEEAYLWLLERTEQHAPAWYERVLDAIASLKNMPSRCPLAPEYKKSGEEVRHLIIGDHIHGYRIIYAIRGNTVTILRFVHGARVIFPR
ncbi:MAG: type II toxin-antitoxin system RelE/ParE family toxin [Phycisphaerales bacterium]|nr:type II toxin-antitoxin system RelE/ParE family toxin [Phycisphaerales bacterium]